MTAATITSRSVVVINTTHEPLGNVSLNKALRLLALEKAVVHEADESRGFLRSAGAAVEWVYPKVIRLVKFVKVNYKKLYGTPLLSKRGVLKRDHYVCAYCGGIATTIDHITPRSRGGKDDWMNWISACFSCNNKKDNRTPKEANMPLLFPPHVPTKAELMGR